MLVFTSAVAAVTAGESYDTIEKDAFGARVLVGYIPTGDIYGKPR